MAEEISSEVIKKTQKILGKHIKKPPLTEKLLKKPPFRFLHDLVSNVIKEYGFLKGLFSDEELQSENIKEKDSKVAFLNKFIDAVRVITKTELSVRASKIVAGLEPTNTNLLLQALGKALESKLDSTDYIKQLNSGSSIHTDAKKSEKKNTTRDIKKKTKEKDVTPKVSRNKQEEETPKSKRNVPLDSSRTKLKDKNNTKKDTPRKVTDKVKEKLSKDSPRKAKDTIQEKVRSDSLNKQPEREKIDKVPNESKVTDKSISLNTNEELKSKFEINEKHFNAQLNTEKNHIADNNNYEENESKSTEMKIIEENKINEANENLNKTNLIRPKSARPKSGEKEKIMEKHSTVTQDEVSLKPLEISVKQIPQRPKSSLRPPSVRPSSARPGAPRLRPDSALPVQEPLIMGNVKVIVETVDTADDEETVVVENAPEVTMDTIDTSKMALNNKSHLVEQILEKIKEGDGLKKNVDIDWESNSQNKDGMKETSQLRNFIQNITKTANPLGKLLNYLHEDIDAMHSELQMWTNTKKQLFVEIQKQKRLSAESNKPLLAQLEQLQRDIKKQQQEIINVQSNIIKNDLRITELLSK